MQECKAYVHIMAHRVLLQRCDIPAPLLALLPLLTSYPTLLLGLESAVILIGQLGMAYNPCMHMKMSSFWHLAHVRIIHIVQLEVYLLIGRAEDFMADET